MARAPKRLSPEAARRLWLAAQRLDTRAPFGAGPAATLRAIEHLGYVQIDTINVIERCHHHILWTRIPDYRRADLAAAQSADKTVFEYWTHALSYVPVSAMPFFRRAMKTETRGSSWYEQVGPALVKKVVKRIAEEGPLTIRDIDEEPMEKDHLWASKKPSKRALEHAFYRGDLVVAAREGMVKTYELADRHFGWDKPPKPASEKEIAAYKLDRALTAQGVVSMDSICHLDAPAKALVRAHIEARVRKKALVPLEIEGVDHWARPEALDEKPAEKTGLVHILSPFDPLMIQRKRSKALIGYEHRFEAYVPKAKRVLGYFALPVMVDDEVVAAIDIKTDRAAGRLLIQQWTWVGKGGEADRPAIEAELGRFEAFQLAKG